MIDGVGEAALCNGLVLLVGFEQALQFSAKFFFGDDVWLSKKNL